MPSNTACTNGYEYSLQFLTLRYELKSSIYGDLPGQGDGRYMSFARPDVQHQEHVLTTRSLSTDDPSKPSRVPPFASWKKNADLGSWAWRWLAVVVRPPGAPKAPSTMQPRFTSLVSHYGERVVAMDWLTWPSWVVLEWSRRG